MRLAANAPRFAARFLFTNPAIAIGSVVLTAWLSSQQIEWDSETSKWVKRVPGSGQLQQPWRWRIGSTTDNIRYGGPTAACSAAIAFVKAYIDSQAVNTSNDFYCQYQRSGGVHFGVDLYPTDGPLIQDPTKIPIGDIEFEEKMAPTTLPETAPNIIPMPWPVEMPKLNPIPSPDGQPQPMRIPTGDPYKIPNSDPAEYRRPAIDIVPSPTPQAPWRVDVQPKDIPVPDLQPRPLPPPVPIPPPVPVPPPDPNAPPQPEVDPNAPPEKGEDKQPDLCEKNPDILACAKPELDTPDQDIPKKSFALTYVEETLFGSGSCPANKTMQLGGHQLTVWDFQQTCSYLVQYLRPMMITLATFAAFFLLSPGKME